MLTSLLSIGPQSTRLRFDCCIYKRYTPQLTFTFLAPSVPNQTAKTQSPLEGWKIGRIGWVGFIWLAQLSAGGMDEATFRFHRVEGCRCPAYPITQHGVDPWIKLAHILRSGLGISWWSLWPTGKPQRVFQFRVGKGSELRVEYPRVGYWRNFLRLIFNAKSDKNTVLGTRKGYPYHTFYNVLYNTTHYAML